MKWFKRATELNPYDDSSVLRYGMCLDQIGKHDEALKYLDQANRMDPNSYFNNAYMGWHYVQAGDYAAAVVWLERSQQLEYYNNPVAESYLKIARAHMMEAATKAGAMELRPTPAKPLELPPWDKN
jgi:tetratricopeptide (TPR) repeat protein